MSRRPAEGCHRFCQRLQSTPIMETRKPLDHIPDASEALPKAQSPLRTHREIAAILGIGRARVFHQEQVAMTKLKAALANEGITEFDHFEKLFWGDPRPAKKTRALNVAQQRPFSPQHGWLQATQL